MLRWGDFCVIFSHWVWLAVKHSPKIFTRDSFLCYQRFHHYICQSSSSDVVLQYSDRAVNPWLSRNTLQNVFAVKRPWTRIQYCLIPYRGYIVSYYDIHANCVTPNLGRDYKAKISIWMPWNSTSLPLRHFADLCNSRSVIWPEVNLSVLRHPFTDRNTRKVRSDRGLWYNTALRPIDH